MTAATRAPRRGAPTRRHFLSTAGAALALAAAPSAARAAKQGHRPPNVGSGTGNLKAVLYPINQPNTGGPYPEQAFARYSANSGKWGVSFSGGGPRAFSAALGQMRGLFNAGVVNNVGALSCVSGGSWFGTTYTFAPQRFPDTTLLGPLVPPAALTVDALNQIDDDCLGARMNDLSDDYIAAILAVELIKYELGDIPFDKLYSRALNDALLLPYGLENTDTLFTLNQASLQAIRARNPNLTAPFQLPRTGRPFLIINGTQIYQQNQQEQTPVQEVGLPGQFYRGIEYTPLYSGAAQLVQQGAPTNLPYGGGYVESFAFDTPAPTGRSQNVAQVPSGQYPFLLSDMMGSSSAAIAAYVEEFLPTKYLGYDPFPSFDYWPVSKIGQVSAMEYDFGDGGILENTGVVSLLRRGYRTIFAFVNSPFPIGSTSDGCVEGIDGQISRLFGLIPKQDYGTSQSTQVFATAQFDSVAQGLKAARAAGGVPVFAGRFPVIAGNPFGLAPYTPKIFWLYNDLNESWYSQLQPSVQALFSNPAYTLGNFPNYNTVLQNTDELLYLSPTQVNLLAHMWAYGVNVGFQTKGYAFGTPIG